MRGGSSDPSHKLNLVISGWLCILIGAGAILSDGSALVISVAAPISLAGLGLLIMGLSMSGGLRTEEVSSWVPDATLMPDAGRPMFRVDTTLQDPIKTSILCGRCANIEVVEGRKPRSYSCSSCGHELWSKEEE